MTGKQKCNVLKQIRQDIARKNDIPFETNECTHTGDCKGTCPKCESEVRFLERELKKKRSLGKVVALAGVSAATVVGLSGCTANPVEQVVETAERIFDRLQHREIVELDGDVAYIPDNLDIGELEGEPIEILTGEYDYDPTQEREVIDQSIDPEDDMLSGMIEYVGDEEACYASE